MKKNNTFTYLILFSISYRSINFRVAKQFCKILEAEEMTILKRQFLIEVNWVSTSMFMNFKLRIASNLQIIWGGTINPFMLKKNQVMMILKRQFLIWVNWVSTSTMFMKFELRIATYELVLLMYFRSFWNDLTSISGTWKKFKNFTTYSELNMSKTI